MTSKTAYLWGPVSSFSGALAAFLLQKGWHVHVATKGAFHFALSPLDLRSSAQESLERALGGIENYKTFADRLRFLDVNDSARGTKYDAVIFCGLPPNFDEPRVSRAPWAAEQFLRITRKLRGVPIFIVSSIWGAVQADGVVPEEMECERRKPLSQFEGVAQQYENRILKNIGHEEAPWYLVRLPMISGSSIDGKILNLSGPMTLLERLVLASEQPNKDKEKPKALALSYNPDTTLWFLPVDVAVYVFWRFLEDESRPRICNLVSTQATLNRECLQDMAKVLGYKKAAAIEGDPFSLPAFLRKSFHDNVQVKTRGLFEVMGRYQQPPTLLGVQYFERLLDFGRQQNWGKLPSEKNGGRPPLEYSEQLANDYLMKFLPQNLKSKDLKELLAGGGALGFFVNDGQATLSWHLTLDNERPVVEPADGQSAKPKIAIHFTAAGLTQLIQRRVSLERALVQREIRIDGKPMDILKTCNFLKRFFKNHPYRDPAVETTPLLQPESQPQQAPQSQPPARPLSKSGKKK